MQGARVIEQIHEEASNSRENPKTSISNSTLGLGDEVRATLNLPNMKRTVQRQRERDLAASVNLRSLATLVLPIEYTQILLDANVGPERFLLQDRRRSHSHLWYGC